MKLINPLTPVIMMMFMTDATMEVINRSVCLFHEYHGLCEDDYEGVFYWDPETGLFGADYWTTAGYCTKGCPKLEDFAWTPDQVYADKIPQEYKERIQTDLRDRVSSRKDEMVKTACEYYSRWYDKYAYQHEAFDAFMKNFEEIFDCMVADIDSIAYLLNYVPECTSGSYTNNKDSIAFAVKDKSLMTLVAQACESQPIAKRARKVSTDGMTRFEGIVVSVKYEQANYGLRSDWRMICKVGLSQGEGKKSIWFNAPKKLSAKKGQILEVFTKDFTEYERSIQVRRPVVNVVADI